jgi:hypothetical protein
MSLDLTIGLGTALVLVLLAVLLLRGRFGKRPDRPRRQDPAERWLHSDTSSTPPASDSASRSDADDPGGDGNGD